ncbi:MAG: helix-turn-helix domain-containing protein [Pseudomonadales bacterium]|jgi:predicted DNA-binding transcriptional regulator AlpA|nr:helix-turn-helix domain-containing protein [Pseudomonadales bacterium]
MAARRLLTWPQVAEILGVHVSTAYRLAKTEPGFPQAIRIGPNTSRIDEAELFAFVDEKAQGRRAHT